MGFLNLGKKRTLPRDIPPLPSMEELKRPSFEDLPPLPKLNLSDLPPLPKFQSKTEKDYDDLPELPPLPKLNVNRTFEIPPAKPKMEEFGREISNGPVFPDIPEEHIAPLELPPWPEAKAKTSQFTNSYELNPRHLREAVHVRKIEQKKFDYSKEIKEGLREERVVSGTLFVRVDDFRNVLSEIKSVKDEINDFNEKIAQLHNIKNNKDKSHNQFGSVLKDLERKYLFIDKTLFETKYV